VSVCESLRSPRGLRLPFHFARALENGLTRIIGTITQLAFYAG
jgi:alkylhydroperoxidase/carboxymuconolactone decarboxylase family protein YurZ